MARFKLADCKDEIGLGKEIFKLAKLANTDRLNKNPEANTEIAKDICNQETLITNEYLLTTESVEEAIRPNSLTRKVRYHYDGENKADNSYELHVVIPDLGGKEINPDTSNLTADQRKYDLSDFACECMGNIVIFGCGR